MKTIWILTINILIAYVGYGQISNGVITYERTINLYKKFANFTEIKTYVKEEEKYRKDVYELHFNDTMSIFFPTVESTVHTWTSSCNTVTSYFNRQWMESMLFYNSDLVLVADSLQSKTWKITDKWRKIADYDCRQAVYQVDDTIRIYAWFTTAVIPHVGPESYRDLPGAILGLANEDGSITYFATKVESKPFDYINARQRFNSKKAKTRAEVRQMLMEKLPAKERDKHSEYIKIIKKSIQEIFLW